MKSNKTKKTFLNFIIISLFKNSYIYNFFLLYKELGNNYYKYTIIF
jgi:hypothetical protein